MGWLAWIGGSTNRYDKVSFFACKALLLSRIITDTVVICGVMRFTVPNTMHGLRTRSVNTTRVVDNDVEIAP